MRRNGALFGYSVVSDVPLQRLPAGRGGRGSLELRLDRGSADPAGGTVVHRHEVDGDVFTLTRSRDALIARCSETGTYRLEPSRGTIRCWPVDGTGEWWEHRVHSMAFPLLLAEMGDVSLHASALAVAGRAVAFAGRPGRGKSTLAAAGSTLGHRVIAEDGVVATLRDGEAIVWPGPLGVRLGGGGGKAVRYLDEGLHVTVATPLAAIVVLGERSPDGLELRRFGPAEAIPALVPTLIFGGSDRLHGAFSQAARLARTVPVYRCSMPDDPAAVAHALGQVVAEVAG